jgi:uncharacterized membrane protein
MLEPKPNPATVGALLDTTWRMASVEGLRTDGLDRKAASLAGFASVILSLTTTLGVSLLEGVEQSWAHRLAVGFLLASILVLVAAVGFAVKALLPKELLTLGTTYLERFPKWSEILKPPEQVKGDTMRALIRSVARERTVNDSKARQVRLAFALLFTGLVLVAGQASILVIGELLL